MSLPTSTRTMKEASGVRFGGALFSSAVRPSRTATPSRSVSASASTGVPDVRP